MQTRRDHVQAYQFVTARLGTALTTGETGAGEQPLRRSGLGLAFGVLIAVLLCAGFAVYGLISPGGATDWKLPGSIIVEKETGNRYLYLDGTLYPTLNSASEMLYFAGSESATFRPVSRNSLDGVPHGPAVGILGAPDSVPPAAALLPGRWAQCAGPGEATPSMTIDMDPQGSPLPQDQRFLVQGADDNDYVVWRENAYPVGSRAALVALGLGDVPATSVPMTWIRALAAGQTLDTPAIVGAGRPGPVIDGRPTTIGQLLTTDIGGRTQTYVLREDGVAAVNATALALLTAVPGTAAPQQVSASQLSQLGMSTDTSLLQGVPNLLAEPTYFSDQAAVCVLQQSTGYTVSPGVVITEKPVAIPRGRTIVSVPDGRAVLATAAPARSEQSRDYYLITDLGEKFALSQPAIGALQLPDTPVAVPTQILAAMPSGPDLVTGTAALTATHGGGH